MRDRTENQQKQYTHIHMHTETYGTFRLQSSRTETLKRAMFNAFKGVKCNTKISTEN